jgi:hypothetical protein
MIVGSVSFGAGACAVVRVAAGTRPGHDGGGPIPILPEARA